MAETFPDDILCELVARGRLASHPPPTGLSGGNLDRRSDVRRSAWRAVDARGQELKLLLGRDLAACVSRQAKFSANAPALVAAPAFFEKVGPAEVIAEPYFAGGSLEARLAAHPSDAARLATAFVAVARHLARTEEPSTDAARRAEWDELAASVCAAEVWSATERDLLRQKILPALFPLVARDQPVTRWTNGDLTPENLLFDEHGALHLVDHEFARRTHFFAIDTVRLLTLSPIARAQPEFFSPHLPPAGPAWHLCFWLQQVAREARLNTAGYNERMRPRRLALIRRLAENLLDLPLDRWSEPAAAAPSHLEQAHWIADGNAGVRVAGWCHVAGARSRRVLVTQSDRTLAESPAIERPDVAAHLGPEAGQSGFELQFPVADADAPLVVSAVADDGSLLPFARLDPAELPGRGPAITGYVEWCATFDPDPPPPAVIPPAGPCFSILLPVYNTPSRLLRACLDSVLGQHYPHWELQLVDDASTESSVRECLREYARREDRLRLQERSTNGGIARATNDALHSASGEFVVLLDHDDVLRPHALLELARQILADPIADVLYSDEDKISEDGRILLPFLKPAFSPEFLRGVMYPGHVLCARTSLAREAGGFDSAYDGVQDYEFFLRLTERTQRITHVPRVLYHWRQSPGSSALVGNVKGDMDARQVAAVRAHLRRRGDPREPVALGDTGSG